MVHKSYYYGIKHIDFVVPKFDPNARSALTPLERASGGRTRRRGGPAGDRRCTSATRRGWACG